MMMVPCDKYGDRYVSEGINALGMNAGFGNGLDCTFQYLGFGRIRHLTFIHDMEIDMFVVHRPGRIGMNLDGFGTNKPFFDAFEYGHK